MIQLLLLSGTFERMSLSAWFLILASFFAFFFLLSIIFGHDDVGDHDVDHDMDHDADHDTDHDTDHDGGGGHMSVFSLKVMLGFGAGFGVGGYIGARNDLAWLGSSICGLLGGLVMGGFAYLLLDALFKRQGSMTVRVDKLVGLTGTVDTTIDAKGVGKVVCTLPSGLETFQAKSADATTIPVGTPVQIKSAHGSLLIVEPLQSARYEF